MFPITTRPLAAQVSARAAIPSWSRAIQLTAGAAINATGLFHGLALLCRALS